MNEPLQCLQVVHTIPERSIEGYHDSYEGNKFNMLIVKLI